MLCELTRCSYSDSGVLMKNIEPLCVWFARGGKPHYTKATANLLIDKEARWTEEFKYIWYNNILVNLCGRPMKFIGIDKVNEILVRKVKDQHNPHGNWQSKEFFLKAVSWNAFLFNKVKDSVNRATRESLE